MTGASLHHLSSLTILTLHAKDIKSAAGIETISEIGSDRHSWRDAHGKARKIRDASDKRPIVRGKKTMGTKTIENSKISNETDSYLDLRLRRLEPSLPCSGHLFRYKKLTLGQS